MRPGFRATSLPTLTQMVAGGAGVTLLPGLALATEAARSDVCLRRFRDPAPHRTLALVWRRRSPLGATLRHLAAIVDGWAEDPDGWWHGDAEDWSGPRLLAGLVRSLLSRAPADRRVPLEAAVRRFDRLPTEDVLRGAELL